MARVNYFDYKIADANSNIPKRGLVGVENGVATYKRLLTPKEVEKYGLIDNNNFTKVAKYRSSKGFTQAEMADRCGLPLRTIQGLEARGLNKTALATVITVADVLGIRDLRDLMED